MGSMDDRPFIDKIDAKRKARMDRVDAFDPPIRSLIHDYGLNVVQSLWDIGVRKPSHIRHAVETVLNEFSPTRGACSNQGTRRAEGYRSKTIESE